jgi:hypothetical protein
MTETQDLEAVAAKVLETARKWISLIVAGMMSDDRYPSNL